MSNVTIGYINIGKNKVGQPIGQATSPSVLGSSQTMSLTINQLQEGVSLRGRRVVPCLVSLSTMLANALRIDKLHRVNRQAEEGGSRVKACLLFCTPFCRIFNLKYSKNFTLDRRVWQFNVVRFNIVKHSSTIKYRPHLCCGLSKG